MSSHRMTICSHSMVARPRRRAMTLLELILALGGLGLVAGAVAGMLFATTAGTADQHDVRTLSVQHRVLAQRLGHGLRTSLAVLHVDDDQLLLWRADSDQSGEPNLDELQLIERDSQGVLRAYTIDWPQAWTAEQIEAGNTEYSTQSNWVGVINTLRSHAHVVPALWSRDVVSLTFAANATPLEDATLISFRLVREAGNQQEVIVGAGSPRN